MRRKNINCCNKVHLMFLVVSSVALVALIASYLTQKDTLDPSADALEVSQSSQYIYAYNFDNISDFNRQSVANTAVKPGDVGSKFVRYNDINYGIDENNQFPCYDVLPVCGKGSLFIRSTKGASASFTKIERDFPAFRNGNLSIKFYDDGTDSVEGVVAISDNNTRHVQVGIRNSFNKNNYFYQVDGTPYNSGIARSRGQWVQVDFFIDNNKAYATINKTAVSVSATSRMQEVRAFRFFNIPSTALEGGGTLRIDNLLVHSGVSKPILQGVNNQLDILKSFEGYIAKLGRISPRLELDSGEKITIATNKFRMTIHKASGQLWINDIENKILIKGLSQGGSEIGAFYDKGTPINMISFERISGDTAVFRSGDYRIYTLFSREGLIFNISKNGRLFSPAIKLHAYEYMYGLGEDPYQENLFVRDGYVENRFANGRLTSGFNADSDIGRMRTPILMSPTDGVGYALLDDKIKNLEYHHNINKKFAQMGVSYPQVNAFERGFAVYTGSNPEDLYRNFHKLRKAAGYPVMTPKYEHFGVGYEIFGDFGCLGNETAIRDRLKSLDQLGIKPDYIVIGSGYWDAYNLLGCSDSGEYNKFHDTTTDTFRTNVRRYSDAFFNELKSKNIKVLIGMRLNLSVMKYNPAIGMYEINPYVAEALSKNYLVRNHDGSLYHSIFDGQGTHLVYLDANNPDAVRWFLGNVKKYPYAAGFKDDTMGVSYSGFGNYITENKTVGMLEAYSKDRYLQRCRSDYFSLACDIQLTPGYAKGARIRSSSGHILSTVNTISNTLDKVLQISQQHSFSGYYTPGYELGGSLSLNDGVAKTDAASQGIITASNDNLITLRAVQFSAFFPNLDLSKPLWVTNDQSIKNDFVYFTDLHWRLQNYLYDAAVESYNSGVPLAHMPLVIQYPSDKNVYNLAKGFKTVPTETTSSNNSAQFMVGRGLLVAPITTLGNKRNVYLPQGTWYDLFTGQQHVVGQSGKNFTYTINQQTTRYPVFAKGGEPFLLKYSKSDTWENRVRVYPVSNYNNKEKPYVHYTKSYEENKRPSGTITVDINGDWGTNWNLRDIKVFENSSRKVVRVEISSKKELMFNMEDGKSYTVVRALDPRYSDVAMPDNI